MTVHVSVNGAPREVEPDATVETVVLALGVPGGGRGVAVAVDGEVIPRGQWSSRPVCEGARLEVVVAVQGG